MTMKRENEQLPGIDESYRLLTFEYAFRQVAGPTHDHSLR
jgi:hypothetical protein